jgi:protein tyrosine phosphatase (PTP) superfamily phosphohydrolase (DUF442 family)
LAEIYNFRSITEQLATGGQPTEKQFTSIHQAGFEVVINLALPTSDNALPHEGSIVTNCGMTYVHIPVSFQAPRPSDFRAFCAIMDSFAGRRLFVHCAANMRVSAFVFLYRVLWQNVPPLVAEHDLHALWEPDAVWSTFIRQQLQAAARPA